MHTSYFFSNYSFWFLAELCLFHKFSHSAWPANSCLQHVLRKPSNTETKTVRQRVFALTDIPRRQEICDSSVNTDAEHCDSCCSEICLQRLTAKAKLGSAVGLTPAHTSVSCSWALLRASRHRLALRHSGPNLASHFETPRRNKWVSIVLISHKQNHKDFIIPMCHAIMAVTSLINDRRT